MKFTTLIPTTANDGTEVPPSRLNRLLESFWRPFRAMTDEGWVTGRWSDDDGVEFEDIRLKVSIDCDRARLNEAIRAVCVLAASSGSGRCILKLTVTTACRYCGSRRERREA